MKLSQAITFALTTATDASLPLTETLLLIRESVKPTNTKSRSRALAHQAMVAIGNLRGRDAERVLALLKIAA